MWIIVPLNVSGLGSTGNVVAPLINSADVFAPKLGVVITVWRPIVASPVSVGSPTLMLVPGVIVVSVVFLMTKAPTAKFCAPEIYSVPLFTLISTFCEGLAVSAMYKLAGPKYKLRNRLVGLPKSVVLSVAGHNGAGNADGRNGTV